MIMPSEWQKVEKIKYGLGAALLKSPSNQILKDMEWLVILLERENGD